MYDVILVIQKLITSSEQLVARWDQNEGVACKIGVVRPDTCEVNKVTLLCCAH